MWVAFTLRGSAVAALVIFKTGFAMIDSVEALRRVYSQPKGRAVRKQIDHIDVHCARFIALSPFVVIASSDSEGALDASPRGGTPGSAPLITTANVPPISAAPATANQITFSGNTLTIPD